MPMETTVGALQIMLWSEVVLHATLTCELLQPICLDASRLAG